MNATEMEVYAEGIEVNQDSIYNKGKSLFFVADILSKSFVSKDIMKRDAWTFTGKELRFRHKLPELEVDALIGHIHKSWFDPKTETIKTLSEVWDYKDSLIELQDQVKNGNLSISAGYKKTLDEQNKEVIGIYGRELSLTPSPKCTKEMGCKIDAIIQNEMKVMTNIEEVMEKLEKTVISQNKERGERIVELETTVQAMETRIKDANEIMAEQHDKIEKLEKENAAVKSENVNAKTVSLRQEIVTLEGILDPEAAKKEMDELITMNEAQLNGLKSRIERAKKIAINTSKPAPIVGEEMQKNENELDKLTPEQLSAKLNPELAKLIQRNQAGRGLSQSAPAGMDHHDGKEVPMIN